MCHKQFGHRGEFLPIPKDTQSELGITNLQTENEIDHMCIGKRFQRTLQDVHVRRGADVASHHHLLVARLKLKLRRNWTERTN